MTKESICFKIVSICKMLWGKLKMALLSMQEPDLKEEPFLDKGEVLRLVILATEWDNHSTIRLQIPTIICHRCRGITKTTLSVKTKFKRLYLMLNQLSIKKLILKSYR
jgi:hypothetical protein